MRLVSAVMLFVTLLTACSFDESTEEEVTDPVEETDVIENKLVQEIPADANLNDWNLLLVNPEQALPENFDVELVEVDNEQRIDYRISDAWFSWKEAALQEGHRLFFASGYRDVARQEVNFNATVNEHMAEGMTEEEAIEKAKEYLTEPGHSEHHTGLALDIVDEEWIVAGNGLDEEYENEASQNWLISSMTDYGFVLRYPKGKEEITGIQYEPWHFRYVGVDNAKFMEENDLVLEEYVELLMEASQ